MGISKEQARSLLKEQGLRATAPRLAVLRLLSRAQAPLSHGEVLERLGETDWDQATIYRNLIKLKEAGLAQVVNRAEGMDRYVFVGSSQDEHRHPHFVCQGCGHITCLPAELTASMSIEGPWAASVSQAMVQLRGECPDCLAQAALKQDQGGSPL